MSANWIKLVEHISKLHSVVVAFSGGVDSTVLLLAAKEALGERAVAVTAESPSLPSVDRRAATEFCKKHDVRHIIISTCEMENPDFVANPEDRCYFCKKELYRCLSEVAKQEGCEVILEGTNVTELKGHRPGYKASKEQANVRVPFAELQISKDDIRELAREKDLEVFEKPSSACLASRIPTGTKITPELLKKIDLAEESLRVLGFAQIRVRDHGDMARIQLDPSELHMAVERRIDIMKGVREAGYKHITLDLNGYVTGDFA